MGRDLPIKGLSERHVGVTPALGEVYEEAARVCLDRHHSSPQEFMVADNGVSTTANVDWVSADARTRNAWANTDDATEAGAYCLALASAEATRGLVAVGRAKKLSGVDYLLGAPGLQVEDFETVMRLEVSGTDEGNASVIRIRLRQKLEQANRVETNPPALATVVGFAARCVECSDIKVE